MFKLMPLVTVVGGVGASSPKVKTQLEKLFNTAKVVSVQTEVNNIAQMVYLDSLEDQIIKPAEFADYLRKNMRVKGKLQRDTSLDFWETPYGLAYDEKNRRLYVLSAGPDKKYNSDDDIYASYAY